MIYLSFKITTHLRYHSYTHTHTHKYTCMHTLTNETYVFIGVHSLHHIITFASNLEFAESNCKVMFKIKSVAKEMGKFLLL